MRKALFLFVFCILFIAAANAQQITQGELKAVGKDGNSPGACPLKNTSVKAEITGFLSRVTVTQEFENNFDEKIEAVYVFPLPQNAAVDDMTMRIGERVVRGKIMRREEAQKVYEAAKSSGQTASLLHQERPNIFTQSVANILPNEKILIEITYVETLKYEDGAYEFVFPMTVGPRYIPGSISKEEAQKITPPIAAERDGHDISIEISLDAGVPIENIASKSHEIDTLFRSAGSSLVKLKSGKTIPNKDFILRYDVSGKKIEDAVLTHRSEKGGFFAFILQPPDEPRVEDVMPKEIVFVLDTSGSMNGFPIEKAKESMRLALAGLNPRDTFNLITFAGETSVLFEAPVPVTAENLKRAQAFLDSKKSSGGTEMMKAITAAFAPSDSQRHLRIVCFMTDGYVGNDGQIIAEIQKHPNARVFAFGIGNSVNRFLLDKMAEEGRGEVEYVSLKSDGSAAAKRFYERVRSPLLTDISLDFGNLPVADVYPKRVNDLFGAKPVIVFGRFTGAASGSIKLKGNSSGREKVREIPVNFPANERNHDVLATLWARTKIADLTSQDYMNKRSEIAEAITNLGLEFRLMTQFTSFVAVEERVVTDGGQPRRIEVPVALPDGMNRATIDPGDTRIETRAFSNLSVNAATVNVTTDSATKIDPTKTSIDTTINPSDFGKVGRGSGIPVGSSDRTNRAFKIDGQDAAKFRSEPQLASLLGRAIKLPKPELSPVKSLIKKEGEIALVQVEFDAGGNVLNAVALSGTEAIRPHLEQAARLAKFKIEGSLGRVPVFVTGVIVYEFRRDENDIKVNIGLGDFAIKLTAEEQQRRNIAAKTSPAVFKLIQRLKNPRLQPDADESLFVVDGKAEVVVSLKELKPEAIDELKLAGFEVITEIPTMNGVFGRIPLMQLAALCELKTVTYISPLNR